jgi:hypothetical protein
MALVDFVAEAETPKSRLLIDSECDGSDASDD